MSDAPNPKNINRRNFLKKTGWTAAGVTAIVALSYPVVSDAVPVLPTFNEPQADDGYAWIQILPDGRVRFFCPRMEMGQGASIGLSQIVAEELNITRAHLQCMQPATNQTPPFQMTVGSESIRNFFLPVSMAAARLRETLRAKAADLAGVDIGFVKNGTAGFILPGGVISTYATLANGKHIIVPDENPTGAPVEQYALQNKKDFKAIGKSWKHHELNAIVTGQSLYSRDVSLEGMAYAQIIHPPAFAQRVKSIDASTAEALSDVQVITIDLGNKFAGIVHFVGIVAGDLSTLRVASDAVQIEWENTGRPDQGGLEQLPDLEKIRDGKGFEHVLSESGDVEFDKSHSINRQTARYDTPYAAHCQMEPRAALADVKDGKVEIWCGSQDAFFVQKRVASLLDRPAEQVVVYPQRMGGGFGGRVHCKASEEAALLSAAIGKPVRVQWSREAEFQNVYFQPAFSHLIDAGVDKNGRISHWAHDFVSSPIITGLLPPNIGWAADFIVADEGTARGAMPPYALGNHQIRYSDIRTDVPIGPWRGLGAAPNAFAIECMMDELASDAKIDPFEFRLNNLRDTDERLANVLRKVGEMSGWGTSTDKLPKDTGRGLACAIYKNETPVAVVALVKVDHAARQIRVTNIWCAHDCGLIINPDQVKGMIEGNIIWGCSMALKEQITFAQGSVDQDNFHTYEILTHEEAPLIEVALVASDKPPYGVGESALPAVAPAIANALFAATGKRVRKLPVRYDEVF